MSDKENVTSEAKAYIEGVGPDAPIVRHESGGMESKPSALFTKSFPWKAALHVAQIVQHGANKYAPNNWRAIPRESHINHALIHLVAYILGDTQDDHFGHFMCRVMMAGDCKDDRPYDEVELGCAKCANDWTPSKEHDPGCDETNRELRELAETPGGEMLDLDEQSSPAYDNKLSFEEAQYGIGDDPDKIKRERPFDRRSAEFKATDKRPVPEIPNQGMQYSPDYRMD